MKGKYATIAGRIFNIPARTLYDRAKRLRQSRENQENKQTSNTLSNDHTYCQTFEKNNKHWQIHPGPPRPRREARVGLRSGLWPTSTGVIGVAGATSARRLLSGISATSAASRPATPASSAASSSGGATREVHKQVAFEIETSILPFMCVKMNISSS